MSSIDSRIVTMKFDNAAFQRGVAGTLAALEKLKTASASLPAAAGKSVGAMNSALGRVNMASVGAQADAVGNRFTAMSVVAVTAIASITHAAMQSGIQLGKSLTIAPISEGLSEYETNLNSIQTIMANTGLEGEKGLGKVEHALNELNHYSDKTIYNFSEMARNIGTFTAAGIDLDTSTEAIKGIANLAAVSGSNSQQASTAMYQLSQALSAGKVSLMDWNSVVNAGMGGQVFRDALMDTARVHGIAIDQIVADAGSFRDSISKGWITSDILTETLSKFTGDLSEAQLKQMGYTQEQIKEIVKMGEVATDAATKVKTASALINTLQETATSGWAKTWSLIFGDFFEARELFTKANDVLGGMISKSAEQRNQLLKGWSKLGGRDVLIESLSNAFVALKRVIGPIIRGFRDIFPPQTAEGLMGLTEAFERFTESLIISKPMMKDIRTIFGALFSVIGLGIDVVQALFQYLVVDVIQLLSGGTGGVIDFTASIADLIKTFVQWIREGDKIGTFFDKLSAMREATLGPIIEMFGDLLRVLAGLVRTGASAAIEAISAAMAAMAPYLPVIRDALEDAGEAVRDKLVAGFEALEPVLDRVRDAISETLGTLSGVGGSISGAVGGLGGLFDMGSAPDVAAGGIDKVSSALQSAAPAASAAKSGIGGFAGLLASFGGFVVSVGAAIGDALAGIWDHVSGTLSESGGHFVAIGKFFGGIFDAIGEYIGQLSISEIIATLNTIFMGGIMFTIWRFMSHLKGLFADMRGVLQSTGGVLDQVTNNLKSMQNEIRAEMILKIAAALGILAVSLYILSKIDGRELANGLGAIAAMLTMLVGAIVILEKSMPDAGTIKNAVQLGAISAVLLGLGLALLALSLAVKVMSTMDADELQKGLLAIGAVIAGVVAATVALNKTGGAASILQAAVAIGILSFAMMSFAAALKLYAHMDPNTLFEGTLAITLILASLGLAVRAFPQGGVIAAAAGILIISGAVLILSKAIENLAALDSGDSWQSILTLGAALFILAGAANAMKTALPGAGALIVMAAALAILVPQLIILGNLDAKTIVIGLLAIVGVFAALGLSAAVLAPLVPVIMSLAIAVGLLGLAAMAIGGGLMLFGMGLTMLAATGSTAVYVLIDVINNFLEAIPGFISRLGDALMEAARQIVRVAPAFIRAGGVILRSFLAEVRRSLPAIGKTFGQIISTALSTLRAAVPDMVATGFAILMGFLNGLRNNIEQITQTAVTIIVKFINGLAANMDRIVRAGRNLIGRFIDAVINEIQAIGGDAVDEMLGVGGDIVDGLVEGLQAGWHYVEDVIQGLIDLIPGPIRDAMGISSPSRVMMEIGGHITDGLAMGIGHGSRDVSRQAEGMASGALSSVQNTVKGLSDILSVDPDFNPTITPVLDLTQMQREASRIGGLLGVPPIKAAVSYSEASNVSAENQAAQIALLEVPEPAGPTEIKFEQHIQSPKALSAIDIYRQTHSQLSFAKEALSGR